MALLGSLPSCTSSIPPSNDRVPPPERDESGPVQQDPVKSEGTSMSTWLEGALDPEQLSWADHAYPGIPEGPHVAITLDQILLDGAVVASTADPGQPPHDLLPALFAYLMQQRENWRRDHPYPCWVAPGKISFWIDRRAPAHVVKRVLKTAAIDGFPNQYLVVKDRTTGVLSTLAMDARSVIMAAQPKELPNPPPSTNATSDLLHGYDTELRNCYAKTTTGSVSVDLNAYLVVRLTIDPKGRVGNVSVECLPEPAPGIAECITNVLAPLRLPVPTGGAATHDHHFRIEPNWHK